MSKQDLSESQISDIKTTAETYIQKYSSLFADTESYKIQLDEISIKLNHTVSEIDRLKIEENIMYEKISKDYNIELSELSDMILDLFNYKGKL